MTEDVISISSDDLENTSPSPTIEIGEDDLGQRELLQSLKKEASDELMLEDGSIVRLGLPLLRENGVFKASNIPHIFESDITMVREGGGGAVKEAIDRGVLKTVTAKDMNTNEALGCYLDLGKTVVIFVHGINSGAGNEWYSGDGQNIPKVVNAYNKYAELNKIPKIELVAACNADPSEVDIRSNTVISPEMNEVRMGAFNEGAGSNLPIAYAVGENTQGGGRVDANQGIVFALQTKRGSIFNIENLIAVKELSPQINLD